MAMAPTRSPATIAGINLERKKGKLYSRAISQNRALRSGKKNPNFLVPNVQTNIETKTPVLNQQIISCQSILNIAHYKLTGTVK
jgi:hypothetical protein